jgi:hypothetical protein
MEAATNPHHEAQLASDDRAEDLWEDHLQAGTCPTEEDWDEITWAIFTEELADRGLTEATWSHWLRS